MPTPEPKLSDPPPKAPVGLARTAEAWRLTALIAALFTTLVGLALLIGHFLMDPADPLGSAEQRQVRIQLREQPNNESLKTKIRQLDLRSRVKFFGHLSQQRSGAWLLLGGTGVFLVAVAQSRRGRRPAHLPEGRPDLDEHDAHQRKVARRSLAVAAVIVFAGLFLPACLGPTPITSKPAGETKPAVAAESEIPAQEFLANWPRFHGFDGSGSASGTNFVTRWNPQTGEGIAWRVPALLAGFSSPIVWGDRVFFSGGDTNRREVLCFAAGTGAVLWQQTVARLAGGKTAAEETATGVAAPTMATDGRRVFVMFGDGDLASFNLDGAAGWSHPFGPLQNSYGHASSLAVWQNRLIVQVDQGESDAGKSRLYALAPGTGEILWQRPRHVGNSWASPLGISHGGKAEIVTVAVPWAIGYSVQDGSELWRVEGFGGEMTPSPAFAGNLLFVSSPGEKLLAIRPGGSGDVTRTQVAWTTEEAVPDITTPAATSELVFTVTTAGVVGCFDATTGKKQWEHDFAMECHASPVLAGGNLYVFGQKGTALVLSAGREFKEQFRTEMKDAFHASPALAAGKIFVRGETNLWCLANAPAKKS